MLDSAITVYNLHTMKKLLLTIATVLSLTAFGSDVPQTIDPRLNETICKDLIMSGIKVPVGTPAIEFRLIKSSAGKSDGGAMVVYNTYLVTVPGKGSFDITVAVGVSPHKEI